jgi:hypothetical protein
MEAGPSGLVLMHRSRLLRLLNDLLLRLCPFHLHRGGVA